MTQREIRIEIFKLLFEYELINSDIQSRKQELISQLNISKSKREFLNRYIDNIIENEENIKKIIKNLIKGWSYSRLGTVEKVILKMSFYEIAIEGIGYEIAVNEAIELSKIYGDESTKSFINGILGDLIDSIK